MSVRIVNALFVLNSQYVFAVSTYVQKKET